ncbi:MAG: hypothetical protein ACI85Q_002096 [Salibacteraceae bacterium]|jgi:hypothetical protein
MPFVSDSKFDGLLKEEYGHHSAIHWTSLDIAKKCGRWLDSQNARNTLDIGSGIGKFCFIAEHFSKGSFTGVEIRPNLVLESIRLMKVLDSHRTSFTSASVLEFDFRNFDSFFYYNPFCEQEATAAFIDHEIRIQPNLLNLYSKSVCSKLDSLSSGTLLITYRSPNFEPPEKFKVIDIQENGELVFWKN